MNVKRVIIVGLLVSGAFLIGTQLKVREPRITTYKLGDGFVAFNRADPLAGLSGLENPTVLELLRKGDTNRAIARMETLLDFSIDDAKHRRPVLVGNDVKTLDTVLKRVADYRSRYPRAAAPIQANYPEDVAAWSRQVAEQNAKFEAEIDTFLQTVRGVSSKQ